MIRGFIAFLALSLSASVLADETTSVFILADSQNLVASVIHTDGDVKTMQIACPSGADSNDCGFPTPVTITAGPSTIRFTSAIEDLTADFHCDIQGTTSATCTQEFTGAASLAYTTPAGIDGAMTTTWATSVVLSPEEITFIPITITAGPTMDSSASATSVSSSKPSTSTKTSSPSASQNLGTLPTGFASVMAAGILANIFAAI